MKRLLFVLVSLVILITGVCFAGEWLQDETKWKYQEANGEYLIETQKAIDGKWYMFDENGYLVTGFYEDNDGKFYYFNEDGTPAAGPIVHKGKTYNISNKGEVKGISEQDFHDYQDALSQQYITGGAHDVELQSTLDSGLKEAQVYFEVLPLSKRVFRLMFEEKGFNKDATDLAINKVNINWKEQALRCAKEYYDKAQLERKDMKSILVAEGFSEIEANYGIEKVFLNDTVSTGTQKRGTSDLMQDYLDKMFMGIFNKTYTEISSAKDAATAATLVANNDNVVNDQQHSIIKKVKKTYKVFIVDDDAVNGKVEVKITVPVPEFAGPKAASLNKLMDDKLFGAIKNVIESTFYDNVYSSRKFMASTVSLVSQNDSELTLQFDGDFELMLKIDLNSMLFK